MIHLSHVSKRKTVSLLCLLKGIPLRGFHKLLPPELTTLKSNVEYTKSASMTRKDEIPGKLFENNLCNIVRVFSNLINEKLYILPNIHTYLRVLSCDAVIIYLFFGVFPYLLSRKQCTDKNNKQTAR